MPIYEYRCQLCGEKFDALRSFSQADSPIECKHCMGSDTHRVLSTCYSHSTGGSSGATHSHSSRGGCGGCSGGSCGSCHH